ncbi:MAG: cysteine desulfurase [Nitrospirae bacterium]|nr:cysteine desulfurase [Nitrospirota bacterium]
MKIYLDHNAATPLEPAVFEAMRPYLVEKFGNPSSIHWAGREVKGPIELARGQVAKLLGCSPKELIFTSGGTEANSTVLRSVCGRGSEKGRHIIVSSVEHSSILDGCKALAGEGVDVTYLPVDREGRLAPEVVRSAIREDTLLVAVMHVNNEIGTIHPVESIGEIAGARDVWFHCDGVQAAGKLSLDLRRLKVDSYSISAHKFGGPKGIGAIYVRRGKSIAPLIFGEQENELRGGTPNVANIVGFGKAAELALAGLPTRIETARELGGDLLDELFRRIPSARLNGPKDDGRLPGTVNVSFPGVEGEAILINLDLLGIAVSTGSACSAGSVEPSHVLKAMGLPDEESRSAVRISLGPSNTRQEIDALLEALPPIIEKLMNLSNKGRKAAA